MDDRIPLAAETVRRMVAAQFPDWSGFDIRPVALSGWDNHTFRLGDAMLVRCPSAPRYAGQVQRDHDWLPFLARHLARHTALAIPRPLAIGAPTAEYPLPWSVFHWIEGETVERAAGLDHAALAGDLAAFLTALQVIHTRDAPQPGPDNFFRGASPRVYGAEAMAAIAELPSGFEPARLLAIWHGCAGTQWEGAPVWLHGDFAPSNLLVREGRLAAVIDFGQMAAGDPACDYAIAWSFLTEPARTVFRQACGVDQETWARGKAWALWKAAIRVARRVSSTDAQLADACATLREIAAEGPANPA